MENSGSERRRVELRGKNRRVILFPLPLQGHINPMLQLASILHSRGLSVTIVHTRFNSPDPSNHPHFTFLPISDGLSESFEISAATTEDVVNLLSRLNVRCADPFRDCLSDLLSVSSHDEEESVACLIADAIWHFTQSVADSLGVQRIVLRTSSVSSFLAFSATPRLLEEGYLPVNDSELETPVPDLPPLKVKDLPSTKSENMELFFKLIDSAVIGVKESSGLILNSFQELEEAALTSLAQEFRIRCFPIGPFHKHFSASASSLLTPDQTAISWLNTQASKSVLYVSFGSIASIDQSRLLEIAWGLAQSQQPFLWVIRPGLVKGSEWLEPLFRGFLETVNQRGYIVKWAPQQEVLAHPAVGGFWTHNGWNSTLESICEGVPMICSPCFGDQMVNARYVSEVWKIGLYLEDGLQRKEIERAIRKLMVEREGDEMRERVLLLKETVDRCFKQLDGSSCRQVEALVNYILSL